MRTNFPENTDSGAQNFGPKQSEADDFLKSKQANPDTEVFGTEVGIVDAMRFKGAGVLYVRSSCTSYAFAAGPCSVALIVIFCLQLLR